jgi:deazaflavin-dependent oxidoreductase (nitroreductase family)
MMDVQDYNKTIIEEFRANDGKVGGQFEGALLLLLTTKGAKSGLMRTNPLAYLADGADFVVVASYAGAATSPPWYHNLLANPDVEVEAGAERVAARAEVVEEPERSALYEKMESVMPAFSEYRSKTTRIIPVVKLIRG